MDMDLLLRAIRGVGTQMESRRFAFLWSQQPLCLNQEWREQSCSNAPLRKSQTDILDPRAMPDEEWG